MNSKVRQLYKNLLFMGRDYPEQSGGYVKFRKVLKRNFQTTEIHGEEDLERALTKGKYIEKEIEALYFLQRYRDMKRKYYK